MNATPATRAEYEARIQDVVQFIQTHLAEPLGFEDLAKVACFSPFHFHRIFRALVGETPSEFIERLRLERAANMLLRVPRRAITSIALDSGYSSSAVFSRSFSRRFGEAASAFRRHAAAGIPPDEVSLSRTIRKICKASHPLFPDLPSTRRDGYAVKVSVLPRLHVAFATTIRGYGAREIGRAWKRLTGWAATHGQLGRETVFLGMSFDNPDITPAGKCRYCACLTVKPETLPGRGIGLMTVPGGRHAVLRFRGKEREIRRAYSWLFGVWLPASGYEPADAPSHEIYPNPLEGRRGGIYRMEICLPLQ